MRQEADAGPEAVLVLSTIGAPERRRLRGRRGRSVEEAAPEPVPTARATLVRPERFTSAAEAERWLAELRGDRERAAAEVEAAARRLNRAIHAHRAASADPHARDVSPAQALVTRLGYGAGDQVAEGRFASGWELPRAPAGTRRSMEAPEERFAAILGGRERVLPCEELVLRARADLDAGRAREAALQARIALESLLAEPRKGATAGARRAELEAEREAVGEAANSALRGDLRDGLVAALEGALERMEATLKRRRIER